MKFRVLIFVAMLFFVMPAQAGIQTGLFWIPAFAGMTLFLWILKNPTVILSFIFIQLLILSFSSPIMGQSLAKEPTKKPVEPEPPKA